MCSARSKLPPNTWYEVETRTVISTFPGNNQRDGVQKVHLPQTHRCNLFMSSPALNLKYPGHKMELAGPNRCLGLKAVQSTMTGIRYEFHLSIVITIRQPARRLYTSEKNAKGRNTMTAKIPGTRDNREKKNRGNATQQRIPRICSRSRRESTLK